MIKKKKFCPCAELTQHTSTGYLQYSYILRVICIPVFAYRLPPLYPQSEFLVILQVWCCSLGLSWFVWWSIPMVLVYFDLIDRLLPPGFCLLWCPDYFEPSGNLQFSACSSTLSGVLDLSRSILFLWFVSDLPPATSDRLGPLEIPSVIVCVPGGGPGDSYRHSQIDKPYCTMTLLTKS